MGCDFPGKGGARTRKAKSTGGEGGASKQAYTDDGQEADVITEELGQEEEVTVGLFLVELLDLFLHLCQLGERPRQRRVVLGAPEHGQALGELRCVQS